MRTLTLADLRSHIAVELGDIIQPPGFDAGRLAAYERGQGMITRVTLDMPIDEPQGRMHLSADSAGLAYVDQALLRPRPSREPIDHRAHELPGLTGERQLADARNVDERL